MRSERASTGIAQSDEALRDERHALCESIREARRRAERHRALADALEARVARDEHLLVELEELLELRPQLRIEHLDLDEGDLERIAALRRLLSPPAASLAGGRLAEGPREAVRARILDELEHPRAHGAMERSEAIGRAAPGSPHSGGAGS